MATIIKPELSIKNKYWIEKHRYYELKHFCLQYPIWIKARNAISCYTDSTIKTMAMHSNYSAESIVERSAIQLAWYNERIEMVNCCIKEANNDIFDLLLDGTTNELTYDILLTKHNKICSKDTYYRSYRKFFWILNRLHY